MPRVRKVELFEIEKVAEFVEQRAQEFPEGRRPHPNPDHHRFTLCPPRKPINGIPQLSRLDVL